MRTIVKTHRTSATEHGPRTTPKVEILRWPLSYAVRLLRRGLQSLGLFPLLWLLTRPSVFGRENLEQARGPVIFVANHNSHLDSLAVLYALPARLRGRTAVAAAKDYFYKSRILGAVTSLLVNSFPFARQGGTRPSLGYCAELLSQGWSILIYPEGTRSTTGEVGRFKCGVGLLSLEHGVPVVPIRVVGLDRVLPKGRSIPRPNKVEVHIGKPLSFGTEVSYTEATQAIEEAFMALGSEQRYSTSNKEIGEAHGN